MTEKEDLKLNNKHLTTTKWIEETTEETKSGKSKKQSRLGTILRDIVNSLKGYREKQNSQKNIEGQQER